MVTFTKTQYHKLLMEIGQCERVRKAGSHIGAITKLNSYHHEEAKRLVEGNRNIGSQKFWDDWSVHAKPYRDASRQLQWMYSDERLNGLYTLLAHLRGKLHVSRKLLPRSDGSGKLTAHYVTMEEQGEVAVKVAARFLSDTYMK